MSTYTHRSRHELTSSAFLDTAIDAQISAAPPPYTTRLSRTRFRTTHKASCSARLASSMICRQRLSYTERVRSHHLVASSHKDGDRPRVGALLDDQHLLSCRSECHLPDQSRSSQLLRRKVLESRHDASVRSDRNELVISAVSRCAMHRLTSISGPPTHRTAGRSFCISK